jgi:hypothetical protein
MLTGEFVSDASFADRDTCGTRTSVCRQIPGTGFSLINILIGVNIRVLRDVVSSAQ